MLYLCVAARTACNCVVIMRELFSEGEADVLRIKELKVGSNHDPEDGLSCCTV